MAIFASLKHKSDIVMKKLMVLGLSVLLLLSSCGTYEATGAYTGATFGSMIGSAIGGITGGWRGSDWGRLAGMAGGAIVGAAVGRAADEQARQRYDDYAEARASRRSESRYGRYDQSGYDPSNSGDDRIVISNMAGPTGMSAPLEIRHAEFLDMDGNGVLRRGEEARVVFEVYNPTARPVYGVRPTVEEVTGNRHIHISENVLVECIQPRQAIRYTAMVKADNRLRDGEAVIRVGVQQSGGAATTQSREFRVMTAKRF